MSVPESLTRSGPYLADGIEDTFDYTFKVLEAQDLQVIQTDLDGVEGEVVGGYSVTDVGEDEGQVIFDTPPIDGYLITFLIAPAIEQQQKYTDQGSYSPRRVEFGFDRIVTMLQAFQEKFTRVVIVPVSSGDTPEDYLGQVKAYRDEAAAFSANTDADSTQTAADRVQTGLDAVATAADRVQTGLDRAQTAADRVQTGLDRSAVASDKATVAADKATVAADKGIVAADKATVAADMATTLGYLNGASAAQTAAEAARDTTLAAFDSFDDRYLGVKSADPTLDNDGNPLVAGSLYYFDGNGVPANAAMKVYTGSSWVAAYVSGGGFLASENNLSDVANVATARTNLGLAIGTNVQAYDAALASIASLTNAANQIIYTTGTDTFANTAISAGGRALINTTAATNAVPYYTSASAASTFATTAAGRALAGLTGAADLLGYFTSASAAATTALTAFGRSLIGAVDAAAARVVLGAAASADFSGPVSYAGNLVGYTNGVAFTNQTTESFWRRVGSNIEISLTSTFSNTTGGATGPFSITLPGGITIDNARLPGAQNVCGSGVISDASTTLNYGGAAMWVEADNKIYFVPGTGAINSWANTTPVTMAVGDRFHAFISLPVVGW